MICYSSVYSKVFQRRFRVDVNFTRNWDEYKQGFGYLDGDFWLGELMSFVILASLRGDISFIHSIPVQRLKE